METNENGQRALHFTLERVQSPKVLIEDWEPTFIQIFDDINDREPREELLKRLANGEDFFLMRDSEGKPVGIELAQVQNGYGAMYIPWTGVLENYRNFAIGSAMTRNISKYMKEKYGVTHTLLDIEDPKRLHASGYPPEELEDAMAAAKRRINFWRRKGFIVIDDVNTPSGQKLEYVRPASVDDQKIQAYDHLIVRFEDESMHIHINARQGRIRRTFVRDCYLQITRIQYGNLKEAELRAAYPAVEKYLTDIDKITDDWLMFMTTPVRPKTSPVIPVQITMLTEEQRVTA